MPPPGVGALCDQAAVIVSKVTEKTAVAILVFMSNLLKVERITQASRA
jgi:hypothetical protein